MTLQGNTIYVRALEAEDLNFLYQLENDERIWEISNTITPYSKFILKQYLENAHQDIFEVKQLRLVICEQKTDRVLGLVDFYDFNPKYHRVGLGIIIAEPQDRGKGYAAEAIALCIAYGKKNLDLHQIFANIAEDNRASIELFKKLQFHKTGEKKEWIYSNGSYKTEYFYQYIYE